MAWSPCSPRDSQRVFSTAQLKASILPCSAFFVVQLSHPYITTRKTTALTRWTFAGKVMSLLFNMLSRFAIAFLPRSKCLLISWLQLTSAVILGPKKIKSVTVSIVSSSICHEVMWPDAMILVWMLSFKPAFSLSSLTFIKRFFSSSLLSALRVVSSAYLRLLIFLCIKKQGHYLADKGLSSQSYGFSSSDVWMWELDHKESWAPKTWCFWTVLLENTLESPLDYKDIQPVLPKGDQSWVFIGRIDVEAEAPTLWPPDAESWLIWKDPNAEKDWGQEEKGMTEDEMVGWHHWLNGHGFGWTPGVGDGQGGLACCGSWGCKELDMTERLNWTESFWLPQNSGFDRWGLCVQKEVIGGKEV